MSITTKKEEIEFLQIPSPIRAKIIKSLAINARVATAEDPNNEWGEIIWEELGEEPYGFFWALRGFQKCLEKGIEIEQDQLDHWNVSRDDLDQIFNEDQFSFYLTKKADPMLEENPKTKFEIKFKKLVVEDVIELSNDIKKKIDQFGSKIENKSIGSLRLLQSQLQNLVATYNYLLSKSEN